MSSEKKVKVKVTVGACGDVLAFECRCTVLSTGNGDGSGNSCFVGPTDISDLFAPACECTDTLCAAFSQAGIPDRNARKEIRDMAAELGVDADI